MSLEKFKYFFSYTRKDSEFVFQLAKDLRAVGASLWLDQLDVLGGQHWDRTVEKALKSCKGMIVVLSPESVASDNVMDEVSYALDEGKLVVPVLIRPCNIPFRLRRVQYIDFTADYDTGFSDLIKALHIEQAVQPLKSSATQEPVVHDSTAPLEAKPSVPPVHKKQAAQEVEEPLFPKVSEPTPNEQQPTVKTEKAGSKSKTSKVFAAIFIVTIIAIISIIDFFKRPQLESTSVKEIARMSHEAPVEFIAFSPDGKYVATTALYNSIARIWDATTGEQIASMNNESWIYSVAFSPDGKYLATAGRDRWVSSPDEEALVHAPGYVRIWVATTGEQLVSMNNESSIYSVVFSPDGKYLATASNDKTARIWEATSGKECARMSHEDLVRAIAFNPDGKYLATASDDKTARIWEATSGREFTRMNHEDYVRSIDFSTDGKYVATASSDNTAQVWEATTGKEIARMNHEASVESIAFSPDGKYLATASEDKTARVWEATSGKVIALMSHEDSVHAITFSPDGKYLATASHDKTARVWEATMGEQIALMNHEHWVNSIAFSPDGKYLATASEDMTARVWFWRPKDLIN